MKPLENIKAVLFDFGGTLDTNGTHWSIRFWEVYQAFRVPVSYEQFRSAYVQTEPDVGRYIQPDDGFLQTLKTQIELQIRFLCEKEGLSLNDPEITVNSMADYTYRGVLGNIADIKKLLNCLKSTMRLGLVSNFYGNVEAVCEGLKIAEYFDTIVDSAAVGISKPEPGIFSIALDNLGVEPGQAVVIGDSYSRDIVPAKTLGCKTVWLKGKSWREEKETKQADAIIAALLEIPNLINIKLN